MENNEQTLPLAVLPDESGAVIIHATPDGFSAALQLNIEAGDNIYVLFLLRGLVEKLNNDPLSLVKLGEELIKKDLEAKQDKPNSEDSKTSNVISLDSMRPKGTA